MLSEHQHGERRAAAPKGGKGASTGQLLELEQSNAKMMKKVRVLTTQLFFVTAMVSSTLPVIVKSGCSYSISRPGWRGSQKRHFGPCKRCSFAVSSLESKCFKT